jgi:hypothetical protein
MPMTCHCHRLELQWQFLENHDYALVGSPYYQIDEQGQSLLIRVLTGRGSQGGLRQQNWFGHGSVMMRREAVEHLRGCRRALTYAQDYDLWLRISGIFTSPAWKNPSIAGAFLPRASPRARSKNRSILPI